MYTLDNSEDLRKYKNEIENVNNGIDLFNGRIIERMKDMFYHKIRGGIEINSIKFVQQLMEPQEDDEIFIKGNFYNERWEKGTYKLQKRSFKAYVIIDIPKERIVTKPKICFKLINLKHNDRRYHWERGFNRFIHLDKIKNYIINAFENGKSLEHFKVQFEQNKYYEDNFSYDFNNKTLIMECKYRGYETESCDRI